MLATIIKISETKPFFFVLTFCFHAKLQKNKAAVSAFSVMMKRADLPVSGSRFKADFSGFVSCCKIDV